MAANSLIALMKQFDTEEKCVAHLASIRWPSGPVCQHCGATDKISFVKARNVFWCGRCKKQFSVRVGTIFEESRLPLNKWFAAIWLATSHKKGISSVQLAKDIDVTQKTAWHMLSRMREAMKGMGEGGNLFGVVEIDETYHGGKEKNKHAHKRLKAGRGAVGKAPVLGMLERDGMAKAFKVETVDGKMIDVMVRQNVVRGSHLMTDEHAAYRVLDADYVRQQVSHGRGEYVRGTAHTNSIEGFWSIFKRGVMGIYHHVSDKHLQRYLDEFAARYNTRTEREGERFDGFLAASIGRRLTYQELIA
jgi:transposase-like protein